MKRVFFKSILLLMLLLVTLFSFSIKSYAASFAYQDFNWDEFAKQNKNYWVSDCDEEDLDCVDEVLATKKKFYTRLYELLAEVQRKGYGHINDNYIIATVFFGLTPDSFKDPVEGEENPYNIDEDDTTKNKYVGSDENDRASAKSYFDNETDSLKTLINNFIGYRVTCYAEASETPQTYTDSNGNSYKQCSTSTMDIIDNKCALSIDTYKGNFFDSIGLSSESVKHEQDCKEKANEIGVQNYFLKSSNEKEVNAEFYWSFLENSDYFDNKPHLQNYFSKVLSSSGYESMEEFYANETDISKYEEDIVEARKRIVENIKDIIKTYGEENFSKVSENFSNVSSNFYWWPIGSDETTESNGVTFASGDPAKVDISSKFGLRTDPVTGAANSNHTGIDIPGGLGVTNVIAAKDGVVAYSSISNSISCLDGGDNGCEKGYGNHVIIQHVDGNYTLYAHLANNSISVNIGDSVKQGQVIGKVGNSGNSTGSHLHFEVRIGGNDYSSVQDPLNYVSPTNPRPNGTSNQVLDWIGNMEGTGPQEGDNYKVYSDSGGVLTVGHGITLKYNADQFRAHGINPDTLSVGSLVPKVIVDAIYQEDLDGRLNNIRGLLSTKGVVLNDNQLAALASLQFNCGNINGFFENYEKYGSSSSLCENWWHNKALHDANGNRLKGLEKRRKAECDLFVNGNYNMNVYG